MPERDPTKDPKAGERFRLAGRNGKVIARTPKLVWWRESGSIVTETMRLSTFQRKVEEIHYAAE